MKLYNRRDFFKFLAKGAATVGAAGVFGLPEVEAEEWTFNVPKYNKDADFIYTDVWTTEQRKRFAREVIELEKQLPGLMPMWGKLHSVTNNIQRLEHYAHKASKAMQKFNNALGIMN